MSSLARYDRSKARYDATSLVILTVDISTKETGIYLLIVNDWWFGCGRMDLGIDVKLRLGYGLSEFYTDLALFWCFDCVGATIRGFRLGSSLRRCRLGNKGLLNSRSGFAYAMGWRMG